MDKIKVMVSSTVKDLIGERQCIEDTLSKLEFVEIVGAAPYAMTSVSLSSAQNTKLLAQNCDLYMLNEISTAQIFTFGKADSLDENGMLIPGVGNLDQRLNA